MFAQKLRWFVRNRYKIPRTFLGLNKMIRAYNLVSRGKPVEAEQLFESGEKLVDKLPFEYKLYKGVSKGHLQKTDETCRILKQ